MKYFDLHCDTLYKSVTENLSLDDSSMQVRVNNNNDNNIIQCYAIWLPDDYTSDKAEKMTLKAYNKLVSECKRLRLHLIKSNENIADAFNKYNYSALFTIENSTALNDKIENVEMFAKLGVKIITLTWNDSNSVGDGANVTNPKGLTDFGRKVIAEMEQYGIVTDVSHASDKLFYDVADTAKRPFIATHSNSRMVADHKRNLTDEQFNIIKDSGGIVGLNFHKDFLSDTPDKANIYDVLRHIEKFLSLNGENTICIGSDFDGCNLPGDIKGNVTLDAIYELLLQHNYKESLIKKIFYKNALNFFENFDNSRIM